MGFFENLNFSSSNEDGESELQALVGARRILCLTGSGTRPLDMLLSDADEVIALDVNPAQNALLHLKVAAIASLDHADFLSFLGIAPHRPDAMAYDRLREKLSPDMRAYWDRNRNLVASGVWYAGKWEKVLRWNARILRLFRGAAIDALMAAPSVEAQAEVWRRRFDGRALRFFVEMAGRRWVWKWVVREPGGDFLPDAREVGRRLSAAFERASQTFLFRSSDFATLVFCGALNAPDALPAHMRPENFSRVRERLDRLQIVQGGLVDLTQRGLRDIDGFSLSDFGSYVGPELYAECWRGVLEAAAPGAKFCERIFMNDMPPPFAAIRVDQALSERLTRGDKAIIYQMRAGTIEQAPAR